MDRDVKKPEMDYKSNRASRKWSREHMCRRLVWAVVCYLIKWSPRPCFGWRRAVLRSMGAKIGREVRVYPSTVIHCPWLLEVGDWSTIGDECFIYSIGRIVIGARTMVSLRAFICAGTHDYTDPLFTLETAPVSVGDDAWICADSFIGPGVKIGDGAVVGARSAVFKDVSPWVIVGGNPARVIKERVLTQKVSTHVQE